MNIDAYRFGKIDIDGHAYTSDVIITPERVIARWRRQEGHNLVAADLTEVVAAKPDVVVVGTGYFGGMAVSEGARRFLESQGIQICTARTAEAVERFNHIQNPHARVVAALHLSC